MSCLLPQFKCQPDTFSISSKLHLIPPPTSSPLLRNRDSVCFCTQRAVSASPSTSTAETAMLDIEKLRLSYVEANPSSLPVFGSMTYLQSEDSPTEAKFDATLAAKTLIENEEAVVAAAAAEALALARAAAKLAKDAALIASGSEPLKAESISEVLSRQSLHFKSDQLFESEQFGSTRTTEIADTSFRESFHMQDPISGRDDMEPTNEELQLLEAEFVESIAVKSTRQVERKAKRVRAAEKVVSDVTVKTESGCCKKRTAVREVNYSDPLFYLRGTTRTSKLLTASEEQVLSAGIQDLLKLEKSYRELQEKVGTEPSFAQWAAAVGVDQMTLTRRLTHGTLCKDKMIASNIRLVVSIAKNYQGAGLDLQDLVQEGCKGLVRGAEKFDASKGFKFSTYAHFWIKQAVRKSLSEQSRTIRLPVHVVDAAYKVKEARKRLFREKGRQPDNEEVAEATGFSMKKLNAVLSTPKPPKSLDQKIGEHMNLKPSDLIADPYAETGEDLVVKQFLKQDLEKVLNTLGSREKKVLKLRFGLEEGRTKTLQEIGESIGVSRERIRQIESAALRKLQKSKRAQQLVSYLFL